MLHLEEVDSTNSWLLKREDLLTQEGLVVYADRQTHGRGRKDRVWEGGTGEHLFCSVVLHPTLPVELLPAVTLFVGLGVHRALSHCNVPNLRLKWPNDLLASGRKLCGILCEMRKFSGSLVVVAGIGINLSGDETQFSSQLKNRLVTLEQATGARPSRDRVLGSVLEHLDGVLDEARGEGARSLFREWERCSNAVGREILVESHHWARRRIVGLSAQGRLMVEDPDGVIHEILAGEIRYAEEEQASAAL